MEKPEVPLEQSQEHINEHAAHGEEGELGGGRKKWVMGVAVSSALFAALAAVASLQAGHHANEAIVSQIESSKATIQASDQWSLFQAKGIKGAIADSRAKLLRALDKAPDPADAEAKVHYDEDQKKASDKANDYAHQAEEFGKEAEHHLSIHVPLARAVTMFQVSIAVAAISVLTQRRLFWFVSLAFGLIGIGFTVMGFVK